MKSNSIIEALASAPNLHSAEQVKLTYGRMSKLLDEMEPVRKSGYVYQGLDDFVIMPGVKERVLTYSSESGTCRIVLTNVFNGSGSDYVTDRSLRLLITKPDAQAGTLFVEQGDELCRLSATGKIAGVVLDTAQIEEILDLFV